jgi:ketosteroid isomerase-like protein
MITSCNQGPSSKLSDDGAKEKVVSILYTQQDCWNNGDIDCFMQSYWNNDSLMFVSGERVSYGWQKVTDNYKSKYHSKELMGTLTFDIHKTEQLAPDAIMVIGSWNLKRSDVNFGGKFSLLWRNIEGEWKIVIDHTS